jgi:hypothetical protein
MSPAHYTGPLPACPHQHMSKLDESGAAYWLESVELINGAKIERADVMAHSADWLTLRETFRDGLPGPNDQTWTIRTAHIVRFRVQEG